MSRIPDKKKKVIQVDFRKLRRHAKANRWTGLAIANATPTGLSASNVIKILSGRTKNPGAIALKAICDVIDFPIEKAFAERAAA